MLFSTFSYGKIEKSGRKVNCNLADGVCSESMRGCHRELMTIDEPGSIQGDTALSCTRLNTAKPLSLPDASVRLLRFGGQNIVLPGFKAFDLKTSSRAPALTVTDREECTRLDDPDGQGSRQGRDMHPTVRRQTSYSRPRWACRCIHETFAAYPME